MLPKRKTKQNYQGLLLLATRFKAAVKIKGDDDRSLKALLGKPQWRFLRPQEPLWDPHIAATFTNG